MTAFFNALVFPSSPHVGPFTLWRHFLLCPSRLNVSLLRYGKGIVHIDAEVTDGTLYLCVT
jgi:hypothetical protein